MRNWLIFSAIGLQLAALAVMAGGREYVVRYGQSIVVRTAPIDPRDPFRGDFVRLQYPFNRAGASALQGTLGKAQHKRGDTIYAVLKAAPGGLHEIDHFTNEQPLADAFLKGRMRARNRRGKVQFAIRDAQFQFGIEQLFVEQGRGLAIERRRGRRNTMQVPMEVELAVSDSGTAVIRSFGWSALGIQSDLVRTRRNAAPRSRSGSNDTPRRRSPLMRLTLSNASDQPLSILGLQMGCPFELILVDPTSDTESVELANDPCADSNTDDHSGQAYQQLAPGATSSVEIDFTNARWHVRYRNPNGVLVSGEIGVVAPNKTFRLRYQGKPTGAGQKPKDLWIGQMPSRAFRGTGFVD